MYENLETSSLDEIAAIWCDEYARTTGCKATVVAHDGDWIYVKTPSHEGQPWQRSHLILAVHALQARPDFDSSPFSSHGFALSAADCRR